MNKPAAPALITASTVLRTLIALPNPVSQSTITGIFTALQIRCVFCTNSVKVINPTSGMPRIWPETFAPEIPTALKPRDSASFACRAHPTHGCRKISPPEISPRKPALFCDMEDGTPFLPGLLYATFPTRFVETQGHLVFLHLIGRKIFFL